MRSICGVFVPVRPYSSEYMYNNLDSRSHSLSQERGSGFSREGRITLRPRKS